MTDLKAYAVRDAGIRWFHWINLLCMLGLIAVGVAILNAKALGVTDDGKILLKTMHVWIGYVFAANCCGVWFGPLSAGRMRAGGRFYLAGVAT